MSEDPRNRDVPLGNAASVGLRRRGFIAELAGVGLTTLGVGNTIRHVDNSVAARAKEWGAPTGTGAPSTVPESGLRVGDGMTAAGLAGVGVSASAMLDTPHQRRDMLVLAAATAATVAASSRIGNALGRTIADARYPYPSAQRPPVTSAEPDRPKRQPWRERSRERAVVTSRDRD